MKNIVFVIILIVLSGKTHAQTDTLRIVERGDMLTNHLEEVTIVSSPKETNKLQELPVAVSQLSQKDMQRQRVLSVKNISALAPGVFIPDYGSRLTSSIYIRGIGSRINTSAAGMYVDNIPYIDKSAFDFNFHDVERIDILRGPQGTLYGRNTMGGLVRINTRNPFSYQGTDFRLSMGTHRTEQYSLSHSHRISDEFAFSASGYYEHQGGFFKNTYTGTKLDAMKAGGGRLRAIWLPQADMKLDCTLSYDYSDQGAYPYFYQGTVEGYEAANKPYEQCIGTISYNRDSRYRRGMLNAGINVEHQADRYVMNVITGFQHLTDRMFLDQDFLPSDIYTLEQRQRLTTLTEELVFKNRQKQTWEWVCGASGFYEWVKTDAPVVFRKDGVATMVEDNVNGIFNTVKKDYPRMPDMFLDVTDDEFTVSNLMRTPVLSTALFHQSTLNLGRWAFILGARVEYEKMWIDYLSDTNLNYEFKIMPYASYPDLNTAPKLQGKLNRDYVQLLPKMALQYKIGRNSNIYATVAKGYRSGGYNIQMFSDLMQGEQKNGMLDKINEVSKGMMERFVDITSLKSQTSTESVVFKPEHSWNYEIGTHLNLFHGQLKADVATFMMDIRNQQIARFSDNGFGRMMVNAGESRSYGVEASVKALLTSRLNLTCDYGYTHAIFTDYDDGETDYTDNRVPFVPTHTLNVGAEYAIGPLAFGADCTGVGKTYWTEDNKFWQKSYAMLNAHVGFSFGNFDVCIWGRNLTDRHFDTFRFVTMNRVFAQHGKPSQVGVDVRLRL
ncbi:MAG: TonB-dependent receptor [Bacteroidales bacterium]|nr:TonB-dependent receptor [Bacteroidales bacterium]